MRQLNFLAMFYSEAILRRPNSNMNIAVTL